VSDAASPSSADDDPFLWLEEVLGDRALAWVRERNAESETILQARPEYEPTRARLLALMNSTERIPQISRRGAFFYNLWQDAEHRRGLWRRTTLADYRQAQPAWETVLDLDALAAAEGENWVWGGAVGLPPEHARVLVMLSRGGADAAVVREFDTVAKAFVAGGFALPEAKSEVGWIDADTLFVGTDLGPGSMTDSGYPRTVRRWLRGTPLAEAQLVFEGAARDMAVSASVDATPGFERTLITRSLDFYHSERWLLEGDRLQPLDVPADASIVFWNSAGAPEDSLLMELRSPLVVGDITYPAGALLAADARAYLAGERRFDLLFTPTATRSLAGFTVTRSHVIVNLLDDVASRLLEWRRTPQGLVSRDIAAPFPGTLSAGALHDAMLADDALAEHYLLSYSDFLTPDTLSLGRTGSDERTPLKALPARFDASCMHAEQCFAISADGTRVPYFIVWPAGTDAQTPADGSTPTLLYGYGGFEVSLQPWYPAAYGNAWVARGGALVVANIRGGGEYGPAWHQAAVGANKQRSYDDFIAVAEDLIARRITRPARLGIEGGSNGGLLVGAAFMQRPELFNAVVCSVPLLDMKRYHRLLAGASWMAEYGDPDEPGQWAFISAYSPYQNVRAAPGRRYPEVLFTTSTRDDRVHPGHARKMAAKLLAAGHPVLYFENIEGGHGGAADNSQRAHVQALEMSYLWRQLGPGHVGLAAEAAAVLDAWFGAPGTPEHGTQRKHWFQKSEATDRAIAERFGPLIERALRGELAGWAATPLGALAEIVLLDQFTRNALRDTPRAVAGDARALRAATSLIGNRGDAMLSPVQRSFVYMPFEHAESLAMQDESVRLFTRLVAQAPELQRSLDYAERHRAVIVRFGRFPHRNRMLGRQSTAEERAFLREPGSGF
jgi:prolyl oligopeptidase